MLKQTPGRIFLAEQRDCRATAQFQRCTTLGGTDVAVHEETLAGGQGVVLPAVRTAYVLVLPVTGAVRVGQPAAETVLVDVEEVRLLTLPAGSALHLRNPYATAPITLLHVWLAAAPPLAAGSRGFAFQQAALANCLAPVVPAANDFGSQLPFQLSLGQFAGRAEAVCALRPAGRFFAFVLAGAFEVEGRLLHANDGLALWDTAEVELEALSNHALVLVLELPGS